MRTPFDPMSNAAANGGDATSTGREGLQQVRLAKSLPNNWAVRMLAYSGRPVFLASVHERGARAKIPRNFLGLRFGSSERPCAVRVADPDQSGGFTTPWGGHVVAAIGRHSSRPKCGRRRDGCPGNRFPYGGNGGLLVSLGERDSLANSKRSGINSEIGRAHV